MTVHGPHPDVHEYGLQDGCPRCAEQAERPIAELDVSMIRDLCHRVRLDLPARSDAEATAMDVIRRANAELRGGL